MSDGPAVAPALAGAEAVDGACGSSEQPLWLQLSTGALFAVLHLPAPSVAPCTAVLICPPFGWEEECAHRGLAAWGRAMAEAGHAVLRIDLPGTRNSSGGPEARRPVTWMAAVAESAAWLRTRVGASRVAALGLGLGGLAACAAAQQGAPVDDLILWSVPARGRTAIRELRMHARVIAARHPGDVRNADPAAEEACMAIGFLLDAEAAAQFASMRLDAESLPRAGARRVLLLERDELGVDKALEAHLSQTGAAISVRPGPGYSLLMEDPQYTRVPWETISTTMAWLAAEQPGDSAAELPPSGAPAPQARAEGWTELEQAGLPIRERVLSLPGGSGPLFAIVTEPAGRAPEPLCAILLSSGSLSHVGPNRAWVELARRWAARGVVVVRVDFPGIGESAADGNRYADTEVFYESQPIDDTLELLDRLEELGLGSRFALVGLCSGAYWGLHAALRDRRVAAALLLNLWAFFFSPALVRERAPGETLSRLRYEGLGRLMRRDLSRDKIRRALRGLRSVNMRTGSRHSVELGQLRDIVAALDRLRDRGTETLLLFGLEEPMRLQLQRLGLLDRIGTWPQLRVESIPSRDHMFRALHLQRHVHDRLDAALDRVLNRVTAPTAT